MKQVLKNRMLLLGIPDRSRILLFSNLCLYIEPSRSSRLALDIILRRAFRRRTPFLLTPEAFFRTRVSPAGILRQDDPESLSREKIGTAGDGKMGLAGSCNDRKHSRGQPQLGYYLPADVLSAVFSGEHSPERRMKPLNDHKTVLRRPVSIVACSCAVPGGKKVPDLRDGIAGE